MTKNGMRGFSAGILISCAIFAFFYYLFFDNQPVKSTVKQEMLTDAQVEHYLEEHQRIALDSEDYQKYQAWTESTASKNTDSKSEETKTDENAKNDPASSEPAESKPTTYTINIKSGMTPGDISSQLVSAKVLKSDQKSDFDQYLHKNKLEKYVQLGKFKVSSDMSIQEIAKVITKNHH